MNYELRQALFALAYLVTAVSACYLVGLIYQDLKVKIKKMFVCARKQLALFIAWIWYPAIYKEYQNNEQRKSIH